MKNEINTVLILGANSGIARELAILLDQNGQRLILGSRNNDETRKFSGHFLKQPQVIPFDGNNAEEALAAIANLEFDIVVYASGYLPSSEPSPQEVEEAIRVNYTTPVRILNAIGEKLKKSKSGMIVGISSVAGDRGKKGSYVYGSAKAGISVFLEELRNKLHESNVHVLTVKPGFVSTPMLTKQTPGFLTSTPQEAAGCIFRAIQKRKNCIYIKPRWRLVMFIIRMIPESIFKKMNW